jgi:hypothetical protein
VLDEGCTKLPDYRGKPKIAELFEVPSFFDELAFETFAFV